MTDYLDTAQYEIYLDLLQAFLIAEVDTSDIGFGNITWIIGDPGQSAPSALPFGYIIPLWKSPQPYSNGLDMNMYMTPLLIVDDLRRYGTPTPNANVPGGLEQPGYRALTQYGEVVGAALRGGGRGITLEGDIATSLIPAMNFVWVTLDSTPYRGVRLAVQAQQRKAWVSM